MLILLCEIGRQHESHRIDPIDWTDWKGKIDHLENCIWETEDVKNITQKLLRHSRLIKNFLWKKRMELHNRQIVKSVCNRKNLQMWISLHFICRTRWIPWTTQENFWSWNCKQLWIFPRAQAIHDCSESQRNDYPRFTQLGYLIVMEELIFTMVWWKIRDIQSRNCILVNWRAKSTDGLMKSQSIEGCSDFVVHHSEGESASKSNVFKNMTVFFFCVCDAAQDQSLFSTYACTKVPVQCTITRYGSASDSVGDVRNCPKARNVKL